jgi:hypothetical protein
MINEFSDEQIISMLETYTLWGKRACREILRRKDDFIPRLIGILDAVAADPIPENNLHIPAALLLAQMREGRAYPRVVELISYDENTVDALWGDLLTEQCLRILRDTFNGDTSLLPRLIEDRACCEFSRAAALNAWGMYHFDGHISREQITGYFRHLIHEVYTGKLNSADVTVLSYIAYIVREHRLEELIDDIQTVYRRNGIDEGLCGKFEKYIAHFHDPKYAVKDRHIDSAIRELEQWRWFEKKQDDEA